jgi:hypothetical protein
MICPHLLVELEQLTIKPRYKVGTLRFNVSHLAFELRDGRIT